MSYGTIHPEHENVIMGEFFRARVNQAPAGRPDRPWFIHLLRLDDGWEDHDHMRRGYGYKTMQEALTVASGVLAIYDGGARATLAFDRKILAGEGTSSAGLSRWARVAGLA